MEKISQKKPFQLPADTAFGVVFYSLSDLV